MSAKTALLSLGVMASLAFAPVAIAHEDGEMGKPQHGGQYILDKFHHGVEMVASDTTLTFYITEHLEPLDLTGTSFKAVVQSDSGTTLLTLAPKGNMLTATLASPITKGAKIVLSGKDGHGDAIQARFVKD